MKDLQELIEVFRVQRHDFMNHMQVVSGLLQLNKADKALEYIFKTSQEIAMEGLITRLALPELAATILINKNEAQKRAVEFKWNINTELGKIVVPESVLVEIVDLVLFNGLNLAIASLENKLLELSLIEGQQGYIIKCNWSGTEKLASAKIDYIKQLATQYGGHVDCIEECCSGEISVCFPLG